MKKIVTFGEIMLRLSKNDHRRLFQSGVYNENYGGSEANVAVSLATLGNNVSFISRIPDNPVGKAACFRLNEFGVSTRNMVHGGSRLGTYFFEEAAAMRNSSVVYDRQDSAFFFIRPGMVNWPHVLRDASILHTSGISCAVSADALDTTMDAVRKARQMGITISFDINYRKNLWNYGCKAEEILPEFIHEADIVFGDQGEYEKITGMLRVPFTATTASETPNLKGMEDYMRKTAELFPEVKEWVMAARNQITSNHHTLTGFLLINGEFYSTQIYDIAPVIDPMGVGDAFIAAYLHARQRWAGNPQQQLDFALAGSAMKNNIVGDFNLNTEDEILTVMQGNTNGRVQR